MNDQLMDHLFRHQYGKMVSILTRVFGIQHLEVVEDAVQDTFIKAMVSWRTKMPENPEAWLTKAAKNRIIDIFRKVNTAEKHLPNIMAGPSVSAINDLFLDDEIEDSQLRMIFTACHPTLHGRDQIAFALKTIAGFSVKEIAGALLTKEETIKKRLSRAKKTFKENNITFEIPQGVALKERLDRVHDVLYLLFSEGFHSIQQQLLVRKELCGEAIRLCKMLLKKPQTASGAGYALFALMCFHAARLDSKTDANGNAVDLKLQDRSKWYKPLVGVGDKAMEKAVDGTNLTAFHYEAAIASVHLSAPTFEATNWSAILTWYEKLHELEPNPSHLLNKSMALLQLNRLDECWTVLNNIDSNDLAQRSYLLSGTKAEYFLKKGDFSAAIGQLDEAIDSVQNDAEKAYLEQKKLKFLTN